MSNVSGVKQKFLNAHNWMYDLRLPRNRKEYFDYYEKTLVEEKLEELITNKIFLVENPEDTEDVIVSNDTIWSENCLRSYDTFHELKSPYFYNLTLAEKIYGIEFIVEIVYYSVQLYIRNFIDDVEKYQSKTKDMENYFVDVNELKKHINIKETSEESLKASQNYCNDLYDKRDLILRSRAPHLKERFKCIGRNNYLYRDDVKRENGFDSDPCDSFNFCFYTEEDKKKLIRAIILYWFIIRINF